ncbi:ABC transporter ATP-binding protein [Virgibacillus profundi]|uniref:ABC transporter ATP-binding protein n=1 Tax=Virgibacillus profundi TaxID=2024555 RepID=A0A2A2IIV0_9BACI|nr:ABC transporter ATP-binding protein [Virgibacillus profundi]PAV31318.1 ABC transporter ATP-binding protein [Virgibacillus profundi]PXY55503.1 ABC transporter ATP-binding protein [Virgibacillus profundi]
MNDFVKLEGIQQQFDKEQVLKKVDLTIPKGQLFGLLGPSGSGKTTLVKIMIGLLNPTKGTVSIANQKMPSLKQLQEIGYMAQNDALYSELTGKQNLEFFASIYGIFKKERAERVDEAAKIVNLTDHLHKTLEHYSGGMKRRMSLAVALLHRPSLLILDEPTVGIDPVLRASIWKDLKAIQETGTTIIITTHVMDEAEKCDELALLRDGYMIAKGSPDELKEKSKTETLEDAFLYFGKSQQVEVG